MSTESSFKIGILSMGEMGAGIARMLVAHGFEVATNCQGRRYVTTYIAASGSRT